MQSTFDTIVKLYRKKVKGVASEEELLELDFLMSASCMNEKLLRIKLQKSIKNI